VDCAALTANYRCLDLSVASSSLLILASIPRLIYL
jgi:hypothetical protein